MVMVVGVDARDMVGALATISTAVVIVSDAVADVAPGGEEAAYFI